MHDIAVILCTKNRPDDLRITIDSIVAHSGELAGRTWDLIVIDDGALDASLIASFGKSVESKGGRFRYLKKISDPGLYHSRRVAVAATQAEIVLFLDDDVTLREGFLARILAAFTASDVAGAGGVDEATRSAGLLARIYDRISLYSSTAPGKLSVTSYGGNMPDWNAQTAPFESEFFLGCCMAFRRSAIVDLPRDTPFSGYSIGEDIFLTLHARRSGRTLVVPQARLLHRQSPSARSSSYAVSKARIVNHWYIARTFFKRRALRLATTVSATAITAKFLARAARDLGSDRMASHLGAARGTLSGLNSVLRGRIT